MRRPTFSVVLYLVLVFLSGVLVGGIGFEVYTTRSVKAAPNRDDLLHRYREEMQTRLRLRPDQMKQLDAILEATHGRFRQLREKYRPEVHAIQDEQAEQIRGILDAQQRAEYEKMREEREKHQPPQKGHAGC